MIDVTRGDAATTTNLEVAAEAEVRLNAACVLLRAAQTPNSTIGTEDGIYSARMMIAAANEWLDKWTGHAVEVP